jgi:hypothetical protein
MRNRMAHEPPQPEPFDLEEAARFLADLPTTSETPGVHRDELADELIGAARKYVDREDTHRRFVGRNYE